MALVRVCLNVGCSGLTFVIHDMPFECVDTSLHLFQESFVTDHLKILALFYFPFWRIPIMYMLDIL